MRRAKWLVWGAIVSCLIPAVAQRRAERPLVFGVNRVGGEFAVFDAPEYKDSLFERIRQAGGTLVRLAASPRDIERVQGQRDWTVLDDDIDRSLAYGQEILVCIVNTPAWASPTGEDTHQYAYKPELFPQFVDFCRDLAARTRGRVKYFQLWNEQNGCSWHFHDGWNHADEYIPFLAACRDGLKQGNPEAILFMGSLDDAAGHAPIFLNRSYDEIKYNFGNRLLWDGLTTHPYSWSTEEMKKKLDALHTIQQQHDHGHLPIWITEYGWHTGETPLDAQGRLMAEFLAAFASPEWDGLGGAIYLSLADFDGGPNGFGLCDANLRPRPAFYEFQGAVRFGASPPYRIEWTVVRPDAVEYTWRTKLPARCAVDVTTPQGNRTLVVPTGTEHRALIDGLVEGSTASVRIVTWSETGKSYASALYTCRVPSGQVYNGDFERGFFGGIGEGWTFTGDGFCADARYAPEAEPDSGEHAQVIWARGERKMKIDATLAAQVVRRAAGTLTLEARLSGLLRGATQTGIEARLGIAPQGSMDPQATGIAWSAWEPLDLSYRTLRTSATVQPALVAIFAQCRTVRPFDQGEPMIAIDNVRVE